jgi:hypothetical protein
LTRGNIRFIASMGSIANFSGVAQIHRRRRTAVEPLRVVPLLADQPGADNLTVSSLFEAAIDAQAIPMWHYKSVIVLFQIVLRLLTDLIALTALAFRRRRAIAAEILVLRRQLALYTERGIKPRRIDPVTRISLALLSRFFNWRDALVVVRPETMLRWVWFSASSGEKCPE